MGQNELENLADDISANGLREPICLYESKILDGRNRYRACEIVKIDPLFRTYTGKNPLAFVVSMNLHRRHLNESQRAMIATRIATLKDGQRSDRLGASIEAAITQPHAAKMLNVSRPSVQRARQVQREGSPDLVAAVEAGDISLAKAIREIEKKKAISRLEDIDNKKAKELTGVFDCIVIDPPWPVGWIDRDVAPNQVALDYPTMTLEEIGVLEPPCADDCHVWLWTTQKFLPAAFGILQKWALKYVCCFVWHKPGGFQPYGLPQYNCEFVLYARRGSPIFADIKDFPTCFNAPRGKHSEKPNAFYETICRVTKGRRLDMFNRRPIDGFEAWGKEA